MQINRKKIVKADDGSPFSPLYHYPLDNKGKKIKLTKISKI
jgi:hypothetical protein